MRWDISEMIHANTLENLSHTISVSVQGTASVM